jgi:hypothetical protein
MARSPKKTPVVDSEAEPSGFARLTLVLPAPLVERVRNAAFWTPGETLAGIGARAVLAELAKIERANGGPFPERTLPMRKGRPAR